MSSISLTPSMRCSFLFNMDRFGCSNTPYHKVMSCLNNSYEDYEKCMINYSSVDLKNGNICNIQTKQ
jgi:hypothetical protein